MQNWIQALTDIYTNREIEGARSLFLHAPEDVSSMKAFDAITQFQCFYAGDAAALMDAGAEVSSEIPEDQFDEVLLRACQNRVEMKGLLAAAVSCTREAGRIYLAQANDMGAKALDKDIKAAFGNFEVTIKHKCRAYVIHIDETCDIELLKEWAEEASIQLVEATGYAAQAGLFGWQKIDKGSKLLAEILDHENMALKGRGADFGCGYGYLTDNILQQEHHEITSMSLLDHDLRALNAAEVNLSVLELEEGMVELIWRDLSAPVKAPKKLDFIVMNPPFHEGKKGVPTLGMQFIKNAADNLKKGGRLIMVANIHLPYEYILREEFECVEEIVIEGGFKIIEAVKG
jgi:16S rRNA (guanine1207-N2)-methyltransferase